MIDPSKESFDFLKNEILFWIHMEKMNYYHEKMKAQLKVFISLFIVQVIAVIIFTIYGTLFGGGVLYLLLLAASIIVNLFVSEWLSRSNHRKFNKSKEKCDKAIARNKKLFGTE